jgi:acetyltransferase-like isoleucine patch superfamily enzyme
MSYNYVSHSARIYDTARIVKARHNVRIEDDCMVSDFAFIAARNFIMMRGSQVGIGAFIGGGGDVTLKPYSVVGSQARLIPATESTSAEYMCEAAPPDRRKVIRGSITIGEKAYIGVGATICITEKEPHIEIGNNTVIGAGTYIDKSVEPDVIIRPRQELVWKKREYA